MDLDLATIYRFEIPQLSPTHTQETHNYLVHMVNRAIGVNDEKEMEAGSIQIWKKSVLSGV